MRLYARSSSAVHRHGHRQVGLAGAGRPDAKREIVGADRLDVFLLRQALGGDGSMPRRDEHHLVEQIAQRSAGSARRRAQARGRSRWRRARCPRGSGSAPRRGSARRAPPARPRRRARSSCRAGRRRRRSLRRALSAARCWGPERAKRTAVSATSTSALTPTPDGNAILGATGEFAGHRRQTTTTRSLRGASSGARGKR